VTAYKLDKVPEAASVLWILGDDQDAEIGVCKLAAFLADNESMEPAELWALASLEPGQLHTGGGGAAPIWRVLRLTDESECMGVTTWPTVALVDDSAETRWVYRGWDSGGDDMEFYQGYGDRLSYPDWSDDAAVKTWARTLAAQLAGAGEAIWLAKIRTCPTCGMHYTPATGTCPHGQRSK